MLCYWYLWPVRMWATTASQPDALEVSRWLWEWERRGHWGCERGAKGGREVLRMWEGGVGRHWGCERGAKRGIECVRGDAKGGMGLPLQNHRRLSEATWGQYDNEFNLIYGALVHHWVTMEQLPDMKSSQTIFGMTFVYEEKNEVFDGFCTREMFPSVVHVHAKTTTGENHGS